LFQGGIDDGGAASVRAIMHWQYRTICRGPNSILKNLYDVVGSKAHDYISFYGLRAHGRLGDGGPLVTNQVKYFLVRSVLCSRSWLEAMVGFCTFLSFFC